MKTTRIVGALLCALMLTTTVQPGEQRWVNPSHSFPSAASIAAVSLIVTLVHTVLAFKEKKVGQSKKFKRIAIGTGSSFAAFGLLALGELFAYDRKNDALEDFESDAKMAMEKDEKKIAGYDALRDKTPNAENAKKIELTACQANQTLKALAYYHGFDAKKVQEFLTNAKNNHPWVWQQLINYAYHEDSGCTAVQKIIESLDPNAKHQSIQIPEELKKGSRSCLNGFRAKAKGFQHLNEQENPATAGHANESTPQHV